MLVDGRPLCSVECYAVTKGGEKRVVRRKRVVDGDKISPLIDI